MKVLIAFSHPYHSSEYFSSGKRNTLHCVKSVRIRSYSGPHFPRSQTEYGEIRIQSECGKMRTRITANADTFYAVLTLHSES